MVKSYLNEIMNEAKNQAYSGSEKKIEEVKCPGLVPDVQEHKKHTALFGVNKPVPIDRKRESNTSSISIQSAIKDMAIDYISHVYQNAMNSKDADDEKSMYFPSEKSDVGEPPM